MCVFFSFFRVRPEMFVQVVGGVVRVYVSRVHVPLCFILFCISGCAFRRVTARVL